MTGEIPGRRKGSRRSSGSAQFNEVGKWPLHLRNPKWCIAYFGKLLKYLQVLLLFIAEKRTFAVEDERVKGFILIAHGKVIITASWLFSAGQLCKSMNVLA